MVAILATVSIFTVVTGFVVWKDFNSKTSSHVTASSKTAMNIQVMDVPNNIRDLVLTSSHHQVSVLQYFKLTNGMQGVVVKPVKGNGAKEIAWIMPGQQNVMVGYMFDRQGNNLTMKVAQDLHIMPTLAAVNPAQKQTVKPTDDQAPPPGLKGLGAAVEAASFNGFTQGNGPVHMTVVIDPNCIFCHKFWTDLHSMSDWQSKFTITWVPVGFLKPSSPGKAAAVLAEGAAGLRVDETNFDVNREEGAIKPSDDANELSQVSHNLHAWQVLMQDYHKQAGTPTLIIANKYIVPGALNAQELQSVYNGLTK